MKNGKLFELKIGVWHKSHLLEPEFDDEERVSEERSSEAEDEREFVFLVGSADRLPFVRVGGVVCLADDGRV